MKDENKKASPTPVKDKLKGAELLDEIVNGINTATVHKELQGMFKNFEDYIRESLSGYLYNPVEILQSSSSVTDNKTENNKGIITLNEIQFTSYCRDHFLPFDGTISLGYIPQHKIAGFGSLAKVVSSLAKRLQIQEDLGREICESIHGGLDTKGVIVKITAEHHCLAKRHTGSCINSTVSTLYSVGDFQDTQKADRLLKSFLSLIRAPI